jgi:hypothetical protein
MPLELSELLLGIALERRSHFHVLPLDLKPHVILLVDWANLSHRPLPSAPDRPRERDDMHFASAVSAELGRRGEHGCPSRVYVVDEPDPGRNGAGAPEGPADVLPARSAIEPALPSGRPRTAERGHDRQAPALPEHVCEGFGGALATPESAVSVGRNRRKREDGRRTYDLSDEIRGDPRQAA